MTTASSSPAAPLTVAVLGATGGIGRAIAAELVARGHAVRAVSRSGRTEVDGTVPMAADLGDPVQAARACADVDVVVMAAQPPYQDWVDRFEPLLATVVDATEASGARLVMVDNLYMYAPCTETIREDRPEHATDPKGALRHRMGQMLLDAHAAGRVRVSIGRFSDYYGPAGTNSALVATGLAPALRGRRIRGLVDLDQPHTFHHLPDAARGFAALVEDDRADGHVWVLPAAPPITQRELLGLVAEATGAPRRIGAITPAMLRLAGWFSPMIRETRSVVPQFDRPWVVDAHRFEDTFGPIATTPHDRAVADTVAWFRAHPEALDAA